MEISKETAVYRHHVRCGLLASYPRSGSTMVRISLAKQFGQATGSLYDESKRSSIYRDAVNDSGDTIVEGSFIKTHEPARERISHPTIIVVRHPRDLFISLRRWYRQANGAEYTPEELVVGQHPWGDWSEWVRSWVKNGPPNAFWIRYDLFDAAALGRAMGWGQPSPVDVPRLGQLRGTDSLMFGPGGYSRSELAECWTAEREQLLWFRHGSVMSMLGFER